MRLAVRGLILRDDRLLMVNAWGGGQSDLLCAPGGGVEPHQSLPDNLTREIFEETGLRVSVGAIAMVNEFHAPDRDFHQVDIYFRCAITGDGDIPEGWTDPEGIVTDRYWLTREELLERRFKPDTLPDAAWPKGDRPIYDPLEPLVR